MILTKSYNGGLFMKEKLNNPLLMLKRFWSKLTLPSKIVFILWTLASLNELFSKTDNLNTYQKILTILFGYLLLVGIVQLITRKKSRNSKKSRTLAPTDSLPIDTAPNIVLMEGEICHYCGPAVHIKTKNVVVGYSGGSRGTSVRIAKGLSVRVGSSKASPVRGDIQDRSSGILSITNKRIIFSGTKKSFDNKIASLSAMTPYDKGIVFQFGSTQYPLETHEAEYIYQILSRIVNPVSNTES